jgi:predicted phage terminase large subunit-like protein
VVGQVHGARGGDHHLLAQTRDRMDFPSTLLAVRQMCGTWPAVSLKLVEDKANGAGSRSIIAPPDRRFRRSESGGGKISRAAAASQQLESGNSYLPHPHLAPWVDGFIQRVRAAFPAGVNDDQVDAWSQGAKGW